VGGAVSGRTQWDHLDAESLVRWTLGPGRRAVSGLCSPRVDRQGGGGREAFADLLARYADARRTFPLTLRQWNILHAAYGLDWSDPQIAAALKVSRRTVCRERGRALLLVEREARRAGILPPLAA